MASVDFYAGDYISNARFVGEIVGQLHLALAEIESCSQADDLLEQVKHWALPEAKNALGLTEAFCTQFLDEFGALYGKLPQQMIHRDPNPGNILCADAQWGMIDFDLAERNARIYDPCYAATAVLSESFGENNDRWLEVYRNIIYGYDSIVGLTPEEYKAILYVILANQFVCVAWFASYEKYSALYRRNIQMPHGLTDRMEDLKP